jgi:tRNA-2-methylthio-N6-dimethylallyladenosine synthase
MESLLTLQSKAHDEALQGSTIAPDNTKQYKKHFYIESYGCAMNFADSEVVASLLMKEGFGATRNIEEASLIFVNTCSIREKAELTIRKRLTEFKKLKKANKEVLVGVLGCMAERLKAKFLEEEKLVDIVVGPDAYRSLPNLIQEAESGQRSVNVLLSREETYADVAPVRLNANGVNAFVSIMRGCNNMCSFCVVPFTRGRERSREPNSIIEECKTLFEQGYREVTLLGQNVDSYYYSANNSINHVVTFAQLMEQVALINPLLRVRFSTSHPKDITDDVLHVIAKHENICNYIHLPVQSGNSRVLQIMNRNYTREWYLAKVQRIRQLIPNVGLSTDIITGFCTETEAEHQDTISLMKQCNFDLAYMYYYSERPGTLAAKRYTDDVPLETKKRRLQEIVDAHRIATDESNQRDIDKMFKVLIEGVSKRDENAWMGRTSHNKVVVFPKGNFNLQKGHYCTVHVNACSSATLLGSIIEAL